VVVADTTGAPLISSTALTAVVTVAGLPTIAKFGGTTLRAGPAGGTRVAFGATGARTLVAIEPRRATLISASLIPGVIIARTVKTAGLGCAFSRCAGRRSAARG